MSNPQNLKPWPKGTSGNPSGKPKGTKHLSTWIQEMMESDNFTYQLPSGHLKQDIPVRAIVNILITKAISGDLKAIDLLAKYGYGSKLDITSQNKVLPTPILGGFSKDTMSYVKVIKS